MRRRSRNTAKSDDSVTQAALAAMGADARVAGILAFVETAGSTGYADPSRVDDHLREASHAFLAKSHARALRMFRALLLPIASADIDLGQDELVDEVLGVGVAACRRRTSETSRRWARGERRLRNRSGDRYRHGMLLAEGRDRQSQLEERIAVLGRYL